MTIEIIRNSEGELSTTCNYQHGMAIDCNDCCNGELEAAYERFEAAEVETTEETMFACSALCKHGGMCQLDKGHGGQHDSNYCQWHDVYVPLTSAAVMAGVDRACATTRDNLR